MKPICPFGLGLMFLLGLSQFFLIFIIFDQLKEPAEGGKIVIASKKVGSYFCRN